MPIAAALIGVVGLLISQGITALRDNAKLKLEGQRESQRLVHDDRKDWRRERLTTYSKYLTAYNSWVVGLWVNAMLVRLHESTADVSRGTLLENHREVLEQLSLIELVGSDAVAAIAREVYEDIRPLYERLTQMAPTKVEDVTALAVRIDERKDEARNRLLAAFRVDLGTRTEISRFDPTNPSPPSATTS